MWKLFCYLDLLRHFLGNTGLEPAVFPLHPQLFQVKGHSQKEQLRADIGLSAGVKPADTKIIFQQGKGTLHLDGAAKAQMNPPGRGNAPGGFLVLVPKSLLETQFFGPVALAAAGTTGTTLTPIPGGADKLAVPYFPTFPAELFTAYTL